MVATHAETGVERARHHRACVLQGRQSRVQGYSLRWEKCSGSVEAAGVRERQDSPPRRWYGRQDTGCGQASNLNVHPGRRASKLLGQTPHGCLHPAALGPDPAGEIPSAIGVRTGIGSRVDESVSRVSTAGVSRLDAVWTPTAFVAAAAPAGEPDRAIPSARDRPPPASIITTASSTSKSFSRSGLTSRPRAPRYRVSAFASEFATRAGWMLGQLPGRLVHGRPGRRALLLEALLGPAGILEQGSDLGPQALALARAGKLAVQLRAGQRHRAVDHGAAVALGVALGASERLPRPRPRIVRPAAWPARPWRPRSVPGSRRPAWRWRERPVRSWRVIGGLRLNAGVRGGRLGRRGIGPAAGC